MTSFARGAHRSSGGVILRVLLGRRTACSGPCLGGFGEKFFSHFFLLECLPWLYSEVASAVGWGMPRTSLCSPWARA